MNAPLSSRRASGVLAFFVLACGLTWACDVPLVIATLRGVSPGEAAMGLAGLGALGPAIAAFVIARRRGELREVFGRWRTRPGWIVVALATMPALHLVANVVEVALGGAPKQWFHPPVAPEHIAALIMFSVGEEFGWRGFAYPRLTRDRGPVVACVTIGLVWTVWHFGMWLTAEGVTSFDAIALAMIELVAGSFVFAWVFERANRSMAVAIALHASAHLDNTHRAVDGEPRLVVLRLVVLGIAALLAARSLVKMHRAR